MRLDAVSLQELLVLLHPLLELVRLLELQAGDVLERLAQVGEAVATTMRASGCWLCKLATSVTALLTVPASMMRQILV